MLRMHSAVAIVAGLLALVPLVNSSSKDDSRKDRNFTVHEWGTFTTLSGSNGVRLGGITHDDEPLPKFVYHYEKQEKGFDGVSVKMETPVIYFYSEKERVVDVKVGFPKGVLTQWYPQVGLLNPVVTGGAPKLQDGLLDWGSLYILPKGVGTESMPAVAAGDPWSHARNVDANMIRNCHTGVLNQRADGKFEGVSEYERFLFYRGLGDFELPLSAWIDGDQTLILKNSARNALDGIFLLNIDNGSIGLRALGRIDGQKVHSSNMDLAPTSVEDAMKKVATALVNAGLYEKEAVAMVRTWRKSYFETDGFRILYIVPRDFTDRILPLTINPVPKDLVRVLVGRYDILTPAARARAEELIKKAGKPGDVSARIGRFSEPVVRHIYDTTGDAELRGAAGALLKAFSEMEMKK